MPSHACRQCGAPLELGTNPGIVVCRYCKTTNDTRIPAQGFAPPQPPQPFAPPSPPPTWSAPQQQQSARKGGWLVWLFWFAILGVPLLGALLGVLGSVIGTIVAIAVAVMAH